MAPNPDLMALVPVDAPRRLKKWSDGASFVVSAKRGTKVRAGESLESALVCVLPPGCRVTAVPFHDTARARLAVADPVAGWVSRKTVAEAAGPARGSDDAEARAALLRVMAKVRRDVVGEGADGCPLDQCFTSSLALVEALQKRADIAAVLGEATMVSGSYDAVGRAKGRPSWWPDDYVDWMPHSFVQFKDGTVVDVSADQFDVDLPRLLHLAPSEIGGPDRGRYAFSKAESHAARRRRFMFRQPAGTLSSDAWLAMVKVEPSHSDVAMKAWGEMRMRGVFDARRRSGA